MSDITSDFENFKKKQDKKFSKDKEYNPLSKDVVALSKLDTGEYEPIEGDVDILQITGAVTDDEEIKEIEKVIKENITLDTSLVLKDIKRGDIIYLTALLEKSKTSSWNAQTMGVVKVRIVDYYYGLNKLRTIKK